jgi:hypothetical protein
MQLVGVKQCDLFQQVAILIINERNCDKYNVEC